MFGRFVWVRVRVMTAAPAPGLSPPRLGSRGPAARAGIGVVPPRPGANQRASRAIPALRRSTNGFEAPATNGPRFLHYSMALRTNARERDLMWAPDELPARAFEEESIANLRVTRKGRLANKLSPAVFVPASRDKRRQARLPAELAGSSGRRAIATAEDGPLTAASSS